MLFISHDTVSDTTAKLFRACFCGVSHNYRATRCKMGYRTDVPGVKNQIARGVSHHVGGVQTSLKSIAPYGNRSDRITILRDMGPLSPQRTLLDQNSTALEAVVVCVCYCRSFSLSVPFPCFGFS